MLGVATLTLLVTTRSELHAQNTIMPDPIQTYVPGFWDADVFTDMPPVFVLGHQWGAARLDKINTALRMNVTSDNFGTLGGHLQTLCKLGEGHRDTNYLMWGEPMAGDGGAVGGIFRARWFGMRWEPAEQAGTDRTWTPRDDDAWPFGFEARYHGSVPASAADVNYRRFKLDTPGLTTTPVRVLDSVEPRTAMYMH